MKKLLIAIMGITSAVNAIALTVGCPPGDKVQYVGPNDPRCRLNPGEEYCYIYEGSEGTWWSQSRSGSRGGGNIGVANNIVGTSETLALSNALKFTTKSPTSIPGIMCYYNSQIMMMSPNYIKYTGVNEANWTAPIYQDIWWRRCKNQGSCTFTVDK